jgi:hypothetical protein
MSIGSSKKFRSPRVRAFGLDPEATRAYIGQINRAARNPKQLQTKKTKQQP